MYRGLAGVWLIFALVWLALLLNQAARFLHLVLAMSKPASHCKQNQDQDQGEAGVVSPSCLQDLPKF